MDGSGILSFFGLLAIIIASVFIIMLIVDWLLCVIDGRDGIFFKKSREATQKTEETKKIVRPEMVKDEEIKVQKKQYEDFVIDDEQEPEKKAEEKEPEFEEFDFNEEEQLKVRSQMIDNREEEAENAFDFEEALKEAEEKSVYTDEDYDKMIEEINENVVLRHTAQEEVKEEIKEEVVEEIPEDTPATKEDDEMEKKMEEIRKTLEEEIASLQKKLAEQQQENEILRETAEKEKEELMQIIKKKAEEDGGESKVVITNNVIDLEEKLAVLKERLKINEKDLRIIKKEFLPLRRVKRTLEKDEKKLRRREALVAKQKVVLYGVNNYVDLDEEKAKKLTEDLDLLEGLKFSVAHCEEVMEKNKERYPILENTYNILTQTNEQIKADIQEIENAIATMNEQNQGAEENVQTPAEMPVQEEVAEVVEAPVEEVKVEEIQEEVVEVEKPAETIDENFFAEEQPAEETVNTENTDFDFFNDDDDNNNDNK